MLLLKIRDNSEKPVVKLSRIDFLVKLQNLKVNLGKLDPSPGFKVSISTPIIRI